MIIVNIFCWLGFHKFNKDFCSRCGISRSIFATAMYVYDEPKGKSQFIEPISDKEKFDQANNINDLLT